MESDCVTNWSQVTVSIWSEVFTEKSLRDFCGCRRLEIMRKANIRFQKLSKQKRSFSKNLKNKFHRKNSVFLS
ncbi:hypothetical protein LJC08_02785 [Methanimicrococcus sp. OttesenSCG-928-J09]|nr:hypothetical protein [Methanimicrococcus sp. OttesenSCG-928-J09]